jgi:hypothetical protein
MISDIKSSLDNVTKGVCDKKCGGNFCDKNATPLMARMTQPKFYVRYGLVLSNNDPNAVIGFFARAFTLKHFTLVIYNPFL